MKLVIGDKNVSSWSMRPWLVLKHFGIPFEETMIRLGQPDSSANILAHSPSGKVPCLVTDAGPCLFGNEFGIADAMFAPVVMRFNSYAPKLSEAARAYCASVTALPMVAEWIEGARKER
jgi:glutathione S-transferase